MSSRRLFTVLITMLATLVLFAAPAFAHHCFNPNKPDGKGVNYTLDLTTFQFTQTGPGKGIGGFATIDGTDYHTLGTNGGGDGTAGNPDAMPADSLCDGKGLDYAEHC